jgi:hypothetical protein
LGLFNLLKPQMPYARTRDEPFPHMYENADFSPETNKNSIKEGELKTTQILDEVPKTE